MTTSSLAPDSAPRHIAMPGTPEPERIVAVPARGRVLRFALEAGVPLVETVRRGFAAAGFRSGTVALRDVALAPFAYVMPALSEDPRFAAFYSATHRPAGVTRLRDGAMTFGTRDGGPFFHCHALWREADGHLSGGHILPEETVVAETIEVEAFGIDGAVFDGTPCRETNFKLFEPHPAAPAFGPDAADLKPCFAIRMRPNQDFAHALEAFCADRGIAAATILGGVGSTIGARFEDGGGTANFATEVYIRRGRIEAGPDGRPRADFDVSLVDFTGALAEGRYRRGDNPVLMTFELVLVPG